MQKTRGRPRQFDEQAAKQAVLGVFWEKGFAATSLDDLSKATGMVRPSLYGAFGSKVEMYLMSMDVFLGTLSEVRAGLAASETVEGAFENFLLGMIEVYFSSETDKQLGCFLVGTAIAQAPANPEIREALSARLERLNNMLGMTLSSLAPQATKADIDFAVQQGAAVLHSIAVRARAGESREKLSNFAMQSAKFISTLMEA